MPVIGDAVTKISAFRGEPKAIVGIKNNIEVTDVYKKDIFVGTDKKDGLVFEFLFTTTYEDAGKIDVSGRIFYIDEVKNMDKIEKEWKKNKKLKPDMVLPVLNRALELGYIQAMSIASNLRLPSPLRMPKFVADEKAGESEPAPTTSA